MCKTLLHPVDNHSNMPSGGPARSPNVFRAIGIRSQRLGWCHQAWQSNIPELNEGFNGNIWAHHLIKSYK